MREAAQGKENIFCTHPPCASASSRELYMRGGDRSFFFDAPKSRESSNTSMITPDEDEVAAGYVHSDQPKAQHNETVNQENNAI